MKFGVKELAATAVMGALVTVATYLIMIPIPASNGYFNIGDAFVIISGLVFGPLVGGLAGGIGSALSDFIGGYYVYVPFTLIIKGCEGLIAGYIGYGLQGKNIRRVLLAWGLGGSVMVLGYFLVEIPLEGMGGAVVEFPFNIVQMLVAGIIGVPVSQALIRRLKL